VLFYVLKADSSRLADAGLLYFRTTSCFHVAMDNVRRHMARNGG